MNIKLYVKTLIVLSIFLFTPSVKADPIVTGSKIMLVGDSLGVGLAPRFKILAKESYYVPITDSIGGTTIIQWSGWIKNKIEINRPDLLLVSLGTNDSVFWGKAGINNHEKIDKLLNIVKDEDVQIVWIGLPQLPEKKLPYAFKISELLKSKIEYYFDTRDYSFQRSNDRIHFTFQGYNDWMDEIWTWMIQKNIVYDIDDECF